MAQDLLRDGSQVAIASDTSGFHVLTYQKPSGQEVHAALMSIRAERAILKSVDLEPLVEQNHIPAIHSRAAIGTAS